MGVIVRDFEGQVIKTIGAPRTLIADSFIVEAYAMLVRVIFYKEMRIHNIILDGDAFSSNEISQQQQN